MLTAAKLGGKTKFLLLVAGSLLALILIETLLRLAVHWSMPNSPIGFVRFMKQQPFPTYRILQGNRLFTPSKNRELVWELVPNSQRGFIRINSGGFRGREYSIQPPPGVRRIAFLGDSETFGEQLREEQTISGCLQRSLQATDRANQYEVLNFGALGYNTAQEFTLLKTKVMNYSPDLVIVYYVFNDPEIYSPIRFVSPGVVNRLYVYQFAQYFTLSLRSINDQRIKAGNIVDYAKMLHSSIYFDATKKILYQMASFLSKQNVPLLLVIAPEVLDVKDFRTNYPYHEIHDKLRNLETAELQVIDPLPAMSRQFTDPKRLWVNPYDPHKNERANLVIASVIAPQVIKSYSARKVQ